MRIAQSHRFRIFIYFLSPAASKGHVPIDGVPLVDYVEKSSHCILSRGGGGGTRHGGNWTAACTLYAMGTAPSMGMAMRAPSAGYATAVHDNG